MPIITCPHCGVIRETPVAKLPSKPAMARCPACRQRFRFDPARASHKTESQPKPACNITCPHCGLPRAIPDNRQTDTRATFNCRRCRRPFRLAEGRVENLSGRAAARKLRSTGSLLTDSWELFCRRGWGLLTIYLLGCLLIACPLLLAATLLPELVSDNRPLILSCLLGALVYALLGAAWMTAGMFNHICHQQLGVLAAMRRGWSQLWPFAGLLLSLGLLILGGSLALVIPGIVFTVWFFFCQYILAEQGGSGLQALEKSRQLVRGHWWPIFGRLLLLLLVALGISLLSSQVPAIGGALNLTIVLLLTPFSLLYYYLLYLDLKHCQAPVATTGDVGLGFTLAVALSGWMLIPAAVFIINNQGRLPNAKLSDEGSAILSALLDPEQAEILEKAEQPPALPILPQPEPLTLPDYDRLLKRQQLPAPQQGVNLGPATLTAEKFWRDDREPHLWLKLQLADLPNLALSPRRSTRILIDAVMDAEAHNRYDQEHSFENEAFHWINILPSGSAGDGYGGIRNIYLKQGTRPEEIRSISGKVEFNLPLGVEILQLNRADIGRTLRVAGKSLKLETLSEDGIALSFGGKFSELLSIRAVNRNAELLPEAGMTWRRNGGMINLKQMFSGRIDSVTVLVAAGSATRSYPFEITR